MAGVACNWGEQEMEAFRTLQILLANGASAASKGIVGKLALSISSRSGLQFVSKYQLKWLINVGMIVEVARTCSFPGDLSVPLYCFTAYYPGTESRQIYVPMSTNIVSNCLCWDCRRSRRRC